MITAEVDNTLRDLSAEVDNTLRDLRNSSYPTRPHRPFRNSAGNWGEFQILTNR